LFGFALAGIVWVFTTMSFSTFLMLLLCIALAIITGPILVKMVITDLRQSVNRLETERQKEISELLQELIDEGAKTGVYWDNQSQVDDWISKVECLLRSLIPEELDTFFGLFSNEPLSINQKRERCLIWLRATRVKFWISPAEKAGQSPTRR
jgi:hypothetical protein